MNIDDKKEKETTRRAIIIKYDNELIKELLYLQENWDITQIKVNREWTYPQIEIVVEGDDLPLVSEIGKIPEGKLTVYSKRVVDRVELSIP